MTTQSRSIQSPERLRAQAIAALVPFFADSGTCDETAARSAAESLLDEYKAATPKELQLSTQIIALGWASLACLSSAMLVKDSSLNEMLRLQGYALALDRSSHKSRRSLEARRKERAKNPKAMTQENMRWDEGEFQLTINKALEKMTEAQTKAARATGSAPAEATPKLSVFGVPMTRPD